MRTTRSYLPLISIIVVLAVLLKNPQLSHHAFNVSTAGWDNLDSKLDGLSPVWMRLIHISDASTDASTNDSATSIYVIVTAE